MLSSASAAETGASFSNEMTDVVTHRVVVIITIFSIHPPD
jgi:hypothetical protein